MSKIVKYKVTIKFSRKGVDNAIGWKDVPRYLGRGATDKIVFHKTKIVMYLTRSSIYTADDILLKSNNTINSQIIKSLLLYYANARTYPRILSVECKITTPNPCQIFSHSGNIVYQVFNSSVKRDSSVHFNPPTCIYEESLIGNATRRALSHWLKAMNVADLYLKFNELWIAFNSLFAYYGNQKQERNNLIYIREQIQIQHHLFPKTKEKVKDYDINKLRGFRWMLLFTQGIARNCDTFCESLFAFKDSRILDLFKTLVASDRIQNKVVGFRRYANLQNHLNTVGVTANIDIALLLCIKYAYFLRNRYQHGIVIANNFKLAETADEKELPIINDILTTVIFELLQNCTAIPQKV